MVGPVALQGDLHCTHLRLLLLRLRPLLLLLLRLRLRLLLLLLLGVLCIHTGGLLLCSRCLPRMPLFCLAAGKLLVLSRQSCCSAANEEQSRSGSTGRLVFQLERAQDVEAQRNLKSSDQVLTCAALMARFFTHSAQEQDL